MDPSGVASPVGANDNIEMMWFEFSLGQPAGPI
jgi:hypothetical protein